MAAWMDDGRVNGFVQRNVHSPNEESVLLWLEKCLCSQWDMH